MRRRQGEEEKRGVGEEELRRRGGDEEKSGGGEEGRRRGGGKAEEVRRRVGEEDWGFGNPRVGEENKGKELRRGG